MANLKISPSLHQGTSFLPVLVFRQMGKQNQKETFGQQPTFHARLSTQNLVSYQQFFEMNVLAHGLRFLPQSPFWTLFTSVGSALPLAHVEVSVPEAPMLPSAKGLTLCSNYYVCPHEYLLGQSSLII